MYGSLQVALALSVAWIQDAAVGPAGTDSGVLIGWFNSHTYIGAPPMNFIGIFIEGPSRIGHYVRPAYANAYDQREVAGEGPVLRPDGRPHD